jgi:hypothetical protein
MSKLLQSGGEVPGEDSSQLQNEIYLPFCLSMTFVAPLFDGQHM